MKAIRVEEFKKRPQVKEVAIMSFDDMRGGKIDGRIVLEIA